jgi:outer membrane protein
VNFLPLLKVNKRPSWRRFSAGRFFAPLVLIFWVGRAMGAELDIRVDPAPTAGRVKALLFDSPNTFMDLRDPVQTLDLERGAISTGKISNLSPGKYALVVFSDENDNGLLDKNFLGIPREPFGFANHYWPKGPPTFDRASFQLKTNEVKIIDVQLRSVFGKRALLGLGVGVIAQTRPYRGADRLIVRPIPAISYIGKNVQVIGPHVQYSFLRSRHFGVAATVGYRVGAYKEEDSPLLQGLGDRKGTLMGGVGVQTFLPWGFNLTTGYSHDLLNRFNGGTARLRLAKAFQGGPLTLTPQLSANWMTSQLTNYEFGVPVELAQPARPAYHPGRAFLLEYGLGTFVNLAGAWRLVLNGSVSPFPKELTGSPLVDKSQGISGFAAITRLF